MGKEAKRAAHLVKLVGIRRARALLDTHHSTLTRLVAGLPVRRSSLSHLRIKLDAALANAQRVAEGR